VVLYTKERKKRAMLHYKIYTWITIQPQSVNPCRTSTLNLICDSISELEFRTSCQWSVSSVTQYRYVPLEISIHAERGSHITGPQRMMRHPPGLEVNSLGQRKRLGLRVRTTLVDIQNLYPHPTDYSSFCQGTNSRRQSCICGRKSAGGTKID